MSEVTIQAQKRIVSFSDTCFYDPSLMVDAVNRKVNMWLDDGGVIIRDPHIIPQPSVAINAQGQTVYMYTCSIVFTEDVSDIPDDEPNGGC